LGETSGYRHEQRRYVPVRRVDLERGFERLVVTSCAEIGNRFRDVIEARRTWRQRNGFVDQWSGARRRSGNLEQRSERSEHFRVVGVQLEHAFGAAGESIEVASE